MHIIVSNLCSLVNSKVLHYPGCCAGCTLPLGSSEGQTSLERQGLEVAAYPAWPCQGPGTRVPVTCHSDKSEALFSESITLMASIHVTLKSYNQPSDPITFQLPFASVKGVSPDIPTCSSLPTPASFSTCRCRCPLLQGPAPSLGAPAQSP